MVQFGRHRQPGASLAHHAPPRITKFEPIPPQFAQGRNGPFRVDLGEILTEEELRVSEYFPQFYEPYEHYPLPIVAIPGNHDGEPATERATSLEGFYRNFLAKKPADAPSSHATAAAQR